MRGLITILVLIALAGPCTAGPVPETPPHETASTAVPVPAPPGADLPEGHIRLPAGTVVACPAGSKSSSCPAGRAFVLTDTMWVLDRDMVDRINASAEANRDLTASLKRVAASTARMAARQTDQSWGPLRWGLVGAVVVGSFALGARVF